jgi:hypothetical protein
LSQELSSSYKSFPESKHVSTALQVIQDSSKSLLLNLPGKEEGPKPGNFPVLLLEEPGGEATNYPESLEELWKRA